MTSGKCYSNYLPINSSAYSYFPSDKTPAMHLKASLLQPGSSHVMYYINFYI